MAFSMPAAVSQRRGGGFPIIGSFDNPLTTNAPSLLRWTTSSNSTPYPNVPLAAITGFLS